MYHICRRVLILCLPLALAAACESSKSANPLSPNVAGPIAGVSIHAPRPVEPAAAAKIATDQQPITLTVDNATTNGVRQVSYIFEIAADSEFKDKVFARAGVEPSSSGRTSLRVSDLLSPEHTYYWHAKADDGANASDYSATVAFEVYTPVVIGAPTPLAPSNGATTSVRPIFTVANSSHSGPLTAAMRYVFEVSTDEAMANRVFTSEVAEGAAQTTFVPPSDLAAGTRYFWRAVGTDSSHVGTYSIVFSFVTAASVPGPTPGPSPNPGPGPVGPDGINMSQAVIVNSPFDLASWPVTTGITQLDIRASGVSVQFSKKDGGGRWPDITPPGWAGPLQYTLGMCLNLSGRWHCSAVVEYWHGLAESGGPPSQYGMNWFYDPIRWGPMANYQPSVGETIGFFVCAGDCRNNPKGDLSPAKERSNVVLVAMPSNNGASYKF